jgi:hypothetical protein
MAANGVFADQAPGRIKLRLEDMQGSEDKEKGGSTTERDAGGNVRGNHVKEPIAKAPLRTELPRRQIDGRAARQRGRRLAERLLAGAGSDRQWPALPSNRPAGRRSVIAITGCDWPAAE